jgi:hypothetical protein
MINRLTYAAHTPADHQIGVWHELKEHLEAVADITASKTQKLKATKLGYYSGLWHDLGKYQQLQIQNEPTPFHPIEPPEEGWS